MPIINSSKEDKGSIHQGRFDAHVSIYIFSILLFSYGKIVFELMYIKVLSVLYLHLYKNRNLSSITNWRALLNYSKWRSQCFAHIGSDIYVTWLHLNVVLISNIFYTIKCIDKNIFFRQIRTLTKFVKDELPTISPLNNIIFNLTRRRYLIDNSNIIIIFGIG